MTPSAQFIALYHTLPTEAQRILLEGHLIPLLDSINAQKAHKVLAAATKLKTRVAKIPILDPKGKKKEIDTLVDALNRDAKVSIMRERSNREELMSEVIDSVVSWLSDIWSVIYEYHENYLLAHGCLLVCLDVLHHLGEMPGVSGCKCSMSNLPITVAIRKQNGKLVKSFDLHGPHSIEEPLLWIWRDLFVSILAHGSPTLKDKLPDMLEDIATSNGWLSLERLLYGGKPAYDEDEDGKDDDTDSDSSIVDDDADSDYTDASSSSKDYCLCSYHVPHWSDAVNAARLPLHTLVESRLHTTFELQPSLPLYNTLLRITQSPQTTHQRLWRTLSATASTTPDTLIAALHIYASEADGSKIAALLTTHAHLLRPRDADTAQCAVAVLASTGHATRATQILERALDESVHAIHAALRGAFPHMSSPPQNHADLLALLALPTSSSVRASRLEQWAETVLSSSPGPMHPMAFAALMMGIPMLPPDGPDAQAGLEAEVGAFLDMYGGDPDLDELREEFRPRLKERFDGWVKVATAMTKSGTVGVAAGVYEKAVERMPFLKGADVVEVMLSRLRDRPSKSHVLVALEALVAFCKKTNKRLEKQRKAAEREAAAAAKQNSAATAGRQGPLPFPFTFAANPVSGGMSAGRDDVDHVVPPFLGAMDEVD